MTISSKDLETKSAEELIQWAMDEYGLKAGLACSFGMEDMVLIDMIAKLKHPITIFTHQLSRLIMLRSGGPHSLPGLVSKMPVGSTLKSKAP